LKEQSFVHFLSRYSGGDNNLKAFRHISQKRMAVARSGIDVNDPSCSLLITNSKKYTDSVGFISDLDVIKHADIQYVHNYMLKEEGAGYRNGEVWVNKSYIPPKHEHVLELMSKTLYQSNSTLSNPLDRAFYLYFKINMIHPFFDGNGRTARAIFDGIAQKYKLEVINPNFIRFFSDIKALLKALNVCGEYFEKGNSLAEYNILKDELSVRYKTIKEIMRRSENQVTRLIPLNVLDKNLVKIIALFKSNPILCINHISKKLEITTHDTNIYLDFLIELRLIKRRRLKSMSHVVLYEFTTYIEMLNNIENSLLTRCNVK